MEGSADFPPVPQALLLCVSAGCTTPDLSLGLFQLCLLRVCPQFQAMGQDSLGISSAVASCGQVCKCGFSC